MNDKGVCRTAPDTLDSYLQQHHQLHVVMAQFEAEPHCQAQANKEQGLSCQISRSKLTASGETDKTTLPCSARQTGVIGAWEIFYDFSLHLVGSLVVVLCL